MAIESTRAGVHAMYCNTTDLAFGPVFDSEELVLEFEVWVSRALEVDPRTINLQILTGELDMSWQDLKVKFLKAGTVQHEFLL
mgnify:FL=1